MYMHTDKQLARMRGWVESFRNSSKGDLYSCYVSKPSKKKLDSFAWIKAHYTEIDPKADIRILSANCHTYVVGINYVDKYDGVRYFVVETYANTYYTEWDKLYN